MYPSEIDEFSKVSPVGSIGAGIKSRKWRLCGHITLMGQQNKLQSSGGKTVWKAANCMKKKWNVVGMAIWEKVCDGGKWIELVLDWHKCC